MIGASPVRPGQAVTSNNGSAGPGGEPAPTVLLDDAAKAQALPSPPASAGNADPSASAVQRLAPPPDSPFGSAEPAAPPLSTPEVQSHSAKVPASSGAQWRRILSATPAAPPEPLLVASGLVKRFGKRQVVNGVDLQVGASEIVGLLGRNGQGKTTTFRMIMGLLHPDAGTVTYQSRDISRLPMYKRANRGIGYLAQQPSIFQRMTVEDNLMAILELQEPSRAQRRQRMEELIERLGLKDVRRSMAATLSGGERRRLEIARALSLNPKIVLFDEPFSGIDPIVVGEIQTILQDLKNSGVGILLTDHNVRETLKITDRTYIMDEGRIWIKGPPREIVANADARARYLGHDFRYDL